MTEEEEYTPRPEITDPVIQVVNRGLFEYQTQLADYFKQIASDFEPHSTGADLVCSISIFIFKS